MPGIIEGIAFMPPPREQYTEEDRQRLGIRKLNLETRRQREAASMSSLANCFSCRTTRSSTSSTGDAGNERALASPPPPATSTSIDGPDFDPSYPYTSFVVAVPDTTKFGSATCPTALLRSWTGLVILFAHGNAEDLSGVSYYWGLAKKLGVAVVAYDYLGYGWSSGTKKDCTEANAFRVVRRMFDFVVEDCAKERTKVFVMGRSLGSGSATHIAYEECKRHVSKIRNAHAATSEGSPSSASLGNNKNNSVTSATAPKNNNKQKEGILGELHNGPFAGLILYSPLYSAVAATGKLWASGIFGDIMCNYCKVGDIVKHLPILIIHGTDDEVIPYKCAKELYTKCGGQFGTSSGSLARTPPPQRSSPLGGEASSSSSELFANIETTPPPSPAPPAAIGTNNNSNGDNDSVAPPTLTASQCVTYLKALPPRRAYFRPMPRCGHNDIEVRVPQAFYSCVTSFLRAECSALGGGRGRVLGVGQNRGHESRSGASSSAAAAAGAAAHARAVSSASPQSHHQQQQQQQQSNSGAAPIATGGYQFQALGKASKPIVADDDPVWGRPRN